MLCFVLFSNSAFSYNVPFSNDLVSNHNTNRIDIDEMAQIFDKELSKLRRLTPNGHASKSKRDYSFQFVLGHDSDPSAFNIKNPEINFIHDNLVRKVSVTVVVNPRVLENFSADDTSLAELVWITFLSQHMSPAKWDFWIANSYYGDKISEEMLRLEVLQLMSSFFSPEFITRNRVPLSLIQSAQNLNKPNLFQDRSASRANYDERQKRADQYLQDQLKRAEKELGLTFERYFSELVKNEKRSEVAKVLNKIIPWQFLPPVEKSYWSKFVNSIEKPTQERVTVYRGQTNMRTIQVNKRFWGANSFFGVARIFNDNQHPDLPISFNVDLGSAIDNHVINKHLGPNQAPKSSVISTAIDSKTVKKFMTDDSTNNVSTIHIDPKRVLSSINYSYYTAGEVLIPFIIFPSEVQAVPARKFQYESPQLEATLKLVSDANSKIFKSEAVGRCDLFN